MIEMKKAFLENALTSTKAAEDGCSCTNCQCHQPKGCGCKEKGD
ncbi:hypothetical protein [Geosporobacter subterraneus]|nr:hypothetical protein [Geosporobacter subterraneus]